MIRVRKLKTRPGAINNKLFRDAKLCAKLLKFRDSSLEFILPVRFRDRDRVLDDPEKEKKKKKGEGSRLLENGKS